MKLYMLLGAMLLGACGVGAPVAPSITSSQGEAVSGACTTPSPVLTGTRTAGEACESFLDCEPACCTCADPARSWRGAACVNLRCAGIADACDVTRDDERYCR